MKSSCPWINCCIGLNHNYNNNHNIIEFHFVLRIVLRIIYVRTDNRKRYSFGIQLRKMNWVSSLTQSGNKCCNWTCECTQNERKRGKEIKEPFKNIRSKLKYKYWHVTCGVVHYLVYWTILHNFAQLQIEFRFDKHLDISFLNWNWNWNQNQVQISRY